MIAAVLAMALCAVGLAFANVSMTHSSAYAANKLVAGVLFASSFILVVLNWRKWRKLRILGGVIAVIAVLQTVLTVFEMWSRKP